jgi:hypothetical protein
MVLISRATILTAACAAAAALLWQPAVAESRTRIAASSGGDDNGGALAIPTALSSNTSHGAATTVHTVHLVFSHHLDVGLNEGLGLVEFCTGFATTIIQEYFDEFIPHAISLALELNSGLGPEGRYGPGGADGRFAYTIHPWIGSLYVDCVAWTVVDGCKLNPGLLRCPGEAEVAAFDAAVRRGDILWADSPMNLNAGIVGEPSMFDAMVDIAGTLNERYNLSKQSRVWNNVDVPGFVRSSIPALLRAGVTALSILANVGSHYPCNSAIGRGCNGAVPTEFVGEKNATMFRWHDPASDEEILVLYHKAQWDTPADVPLYMFGTTYGGFTRLDNMIVAPAGGVALASFIAADNTGPASAAEVRKVFNTVREVFPNAKVIGSTWDHFVAEISPAEVATLPRYSSEWGDKWVAGMSNDPGRLATYRALIRGRKACMGSGACTLRDPVLRNVRRCCICCISAFSNLSQALCRINSVFWRVRVCSQFTRFVSKNSEHTQGVEGSGYEPGSQWCVWVQHIGIACPGDAEWKNEAFRANHNARKNRFPGADDSWLESRLFNRLGIEAVPPTHPLAPFLQRELAALVPRHRTPPKLPPVLGVGAELSKSGENQRRRVDCQGTVLEFSSTGALGRLTFRGTDQPWTQLMDLRYITFRDHSKKGMVCNQSDCPNPVAGAWTPSVLGFDSDAPGPVVGGGSPRGLVQSCRVVLQLGFNETLHQDYGAPMGMTAEYSIDPVQKRLNVSLTWQNKTATRLQEAITVFNRPMARAGHQWSMDVLGGWTSPANVTAGGEQYMHAVWSGVRYTTTDNGMGTGATPRGLWLSTLDAGLACPVLNTVADRCVCVHHPFLSGKWTPYSFVGS